MAVLGTSVPIRADASTDLAVPLRKMRRAPGLGAYDSD